MIIAILSGTEKVTVWLPHTYQHWRPTFRMLHKICVTCYLAQQIEDNDTDTQGTVADDKLSSPGENSSLEIALRASTSDPSRSSSPPSSTLRVHWPLNKNARSADDSDIKLEKPRFLNKMSNTAKFGLSPERKDKMGKSGF